MVLRPNLSQKLQSSCSPVGKIKAAVRFKERASGAIEALSPTRTSGYGLQMQTPISSQSTEKTLTRNTGTRPGVQKPAAMLQTHQHDHTNVILDENYVAGRSRQSNPASARELCASTRQLGEDSQSEIPFFPSALNQRPQDNLGSEGYRKGFCSHIFRQSV